MPTNHSHASIIDPKEVMIELGKSVCTLSRLCRTGRHIRIGGLQIAGPSQNDDRILHHNSEFLNPSRHSICRPLSSMAIKVVQGARMTDEQLAVAKTAPAIAGATIYGFTLQDWVAIATLVYVGLQVGLLMPKYWRLLFDWKNRGDGGAKGSKN